MELLYFSDILVPNTFVTFKVIFLCNALCHALKCSWIFVTKNKQSRPFFVPLFAHLHVKVAGTKFREKVASHNLIPKRIPLLTADSITPIVICHTSQQPSHLWVPSLPNAGFPTPLARI